MAHSWIERRTTVTGKPRYLVKFVLGGKHSRKRYAGSFPTRREALLRKQFVDGEIAAVRVPDLSLLEEPDATPTFAEVAKRWQASRVDVAESTKTQHRTALNRALPILGTCPI